MTVVVFTRLRRFEQNEKLKFGNRFVSGFELRCRPGKGGNKGVMPVQPGMNDSPPDWHGFAEAIIFLSTILMKTQ